MTKMAIKKLTPKVARKAPNDRVKDGFAVLDPVPHPCLLEDPGIDLQTRVNDLTRLSRLRRMTFNQEAAEAAYEAGYDLDIDPEGITDYELQGGEVAFDEKADGVSGREEPSPEPSPPESNGDEVTAKQAD